MQVLILQYTIEIMFSFSKINNDYVTAFWVGIMDGDGSIQVNHWRKKTLQFRLVIKLKNTERNKKMCKLFVEHIGGAVSFAQKNEFVLWVVNSRSQISKIITKFEKYPPLTTRLQCQLAFLVDCLKHNNVKLYLSQRDLKYKVLQISKLVKPEYFPKWLSGFIEAEGCFTLRPSGFPSFSISQKQDKYLLDYIKDYFQIKSKVRFYEKQILNFYILETYNAESFRLIFEHFQTYPLLGEKEECYWKFKVCVLEKGK